MKTNFYLKLTLNLLVLFCASRVANAQEVLINATIVDMVNAKLPKIIVLQKIASTPGDYDVSAPALIALSKAGVEEEIITAMLTVFEKTNKQNRNLTSEINTLPIVKSNVEKSVIMLLREARTILFVKHSLYPSLSDLESSLLKRQGWNKFNLTITRTHEDADLVCEINHEFATHYAFSVVDRKTGKVIAASGVTSLGGALSGNIAEKLIKRFGKVLGNN